MAVLCNFYFLGLVLFVGIKIEYVEAEKILVLLPLASKSHVYVFEPLVRALGERGHEIVFLSPVKSPEMPPNVRQMQLLEVEDFTEMMSENSIQKRKLGMWAQMVNTSLWETMQKATDKGITDPKLHKIIKNEQFDLVIVDVLTHFWILGVIPILKAPSIFVCTFPPPSVLPNIAGLAAPPSFVPTPFSSYTDKMSFQERLINTVSDGLMKLMYFGMKIMSEPIYRRNLAGGESLPSVDEIMKNTSLIFMNTHFALKGPRPLLPDVVEIGGIHTRASKPLKDRKMEEFLNGSGEDGFILFSLGSIVKPEQMPEELRKVFLNVFGRLNQRVLWKWNGDQIENLPKNVMLSKWLPQQDILGHPKIKLFMTHGGLLSIQESVYHGVPVLGLPIQGDQDLNVHQAEKGGYGKFLEIVDLTEDQLEKSLNELLNNPIYTKKVKELSKLVKDVPMTPLDTAVYWTEYVLRHKGAVHLRSAARDLNFFQYYILDVIATLVIIISFTILIILKCKLCYRKVFYRTNEPNDVKLKKQ